MSPAQINYSDVCVYRLALRSRCQRVVNISLFTNTNAVSIEWKEPKYVASMYDLLKHKIENAKYLLPFMQAYFTFSKAKVINGDIFGAVNF